MIRRALDQLRQVVRGAALSLVTTQAYARRRDTSSTELHRDSF